MLAHSAIETIALSSVRRQDMRRFVRKHARALSWSRMYLGFFVFYLILITFFVQISQTLLQVRDRNTARASFYVVAAACVIALALIMISVNTVSNVYYDAARPWEEAYRNLEAKVGRDEGRGRGCDGGGGDAQTTEASQLMTQLVTLNRLQAEQNALLEKLVASGRFSA